MDPLSLKSIVVFSTTTDAMAAEAAVREQAFPARLIPVPREIRASCGMALMTEPDREEELLSLLEEKGVPTEGTWQVHLKL